MVDKAGCPAGVILLFALDIGLAPDNFAPMEICRPPEKAPNAVDRSRWAPNFSFAQWVMTSGGGIMTPRLRC